MAGEVHVAYTTGSTLYFIVRNTIGQVYNTLSTSFEAYNSSNYTDYDHALTEQGSNGYYVGNFPAISAGVYIASAYVRAGGSPAQTDGPPISAGIIEWTGTAIFNINNDLIRSNVIQISNDATAADNLEADYDGTGYNKTNSTIGTATNVTNMVTANITQISSDATAADNLEADYDGTGYNKSASTIGTATNVTNMVTANITQISSDATAADNLEADYDGTGYNKSASTIGTATNVTNMVTANATQISGSSETADNLEAMYISTIANAVVNTVTSSSDFTLTSADLSSNNDDYNKQWLIFTSGSNKYVPRVIGTYTGASKRVQFTGGGMQGAFPQTVNPGDICVILAGSPV